VNLDPDGSLFIDRDGTHFRTILNYLRMGLAASRGLELSPAQKQQLLEEAEFYQLHELSGMLACPAVRSRAKVYLPSVDVHSVSGSTRLKHLCGFVHEPGKCDCLLCTRRRDCPCNRQGSAMVTTAVKGYRHNAGEPIWEVEAFGHVFEVSSSQLVLPCEQKLDEVLTQFVTSVVRKEVRPLQQQVSDLGNFADAEIVD